MPVRRLTTGKAGAMLAGALWLLTASARAAEPPEADPGMNPGPAEPAPTAAAPAANPATAPATSPTAAAPATPTAPPTGGPPAAPGATVNTNASYTVRLHDLERRVDELKEQIFRSKARLNLLKETVLHGAIGGARAVIYHRNEMGGMYMPIQYVYALDGAEIFAKTDDTGKLGDQKEFEVFNGSMVPGNHTLSVQMVYQGNGYGVFSYLKGYKFTAKSSHTFTASEGKALQLKVVGFEKGNVVTTDPKDRPSVDFRETVIQDKDAAKPQPAAKK
jgi:hypothetical protein